MLIKSEQSEPAAPAPLRESVLGKSRAAAGEVLPVTKEEKAAYHRAYYQAHKDKLDAQQKMHRQTHKAEVDAQQKRYRQTHKAERSKRDRAYYQLHKAKRIAYAKAYYQANKPMRAVSGKAYYRTHKKEMLAYRKRWSAENADKEAAYARKYLQTHRDKCLDITHRRRARRRGATVEKVSRAAVFERDGGRCHLCGKKVDPNNWHLDHINPLARGGEHSYKNVAVSHAKCNLTKGSKVGSQLRLF